MGALGGLILKPTEVPIMSFQTDKNGTFDPSMTIASGTLKWIIDGVEYITNSPSVALVGSTVDIEVFANDVTEGTICTIVNMTGQDVIGSTSLTHFQLNGTLLLNSNSGLTSSPLSTFANNITDLRCDFSGVTAIDLTNATVNGAVNCTAATALTSFVLGSGSNNITSLTLTLCNLSSISLANATISNTISLDRNTGLASIAPPTYSTSLSSYQAWGCALPEAEIDEIFTSIDTFMSSNAPTSNLFVRVNGGTNASPSATGNAARTNLDTVVYPATIYDYTDLVN